MLKKIETLKEAEFVKDSIGCWVYDEMKGYSKIAAEESWHDENVNSLEDFIEKYNSYVDFRKENPAEFLVQAYVINDLSTLVNVRNEWANRSNHSKATGKWLSRKEIQELLDNNYYVYIVKNENKRIEREIESLKELEIIRL